MMIHFFSPLADAIPFLAAAAPPAGGGIQGLLLPVGLMIILYFLLIRPQQKRQKEQAALIASVKTGDEVVMSCGIHGMVTNVKDTTVTVKVADNVKIEFDKAAVGTISKSSSAS